MKAIQNGNSSFDEARATLSTVYHDVNNPLAVIAGNAQLLLELAQAMDLGDEFTEPIQDIERAGHRIEGALQALESEERPSARHPRSRSACAPA